MDNKINDKEKLIEYLSRIRDAETEKPLGETDPDLIDSAVKLLLELQNKTVTLTPEKIKEKIGEIPFARALPTEQPAENTKRRKFPKKKFFVIAAIITLTAILAIGSGALERTAAEMLKERFGSVENAPENVVMHEGNIDFGRGSNSHIYATFDEVAKNEDIVILAPTELPKGTEITSIVFGEYMGTTEINICFNEASPSCTIRLNQELPPEVLNKEKVTVNGLTCYVEELDDVGIVQVYFSHNNNTYVSSHTDKQTIFKIIENLEELQ